MCKNIYLIVGPSGVGKTTLAEKLAKEHGLRLVESYTTRSPRHPDEKGYIFVSDEEFDKLGEIVAFTNYNGFRYGVTPEIINAHDLYVIDPYGVQYLLEHYHGPKGVVVIELYANLDEIRSRMRRRGDKPEDIKKRLEYDAKAFDYSRYKFRFDFQTHADGIEETAKIVWEYIMFREKYDYDVRIYQINPKWDTERLCFTGSEHLKKTGYVVNGKVYVNLSIYDEVWAGDIPDATPEEVFSIFNRDDRPNADIVRSVSVSDIVEIAHNKNPEINGMWFCDSFGWKRISNRGAIME